MISPRSAELNQMHFNNQHPNNNNNQNAAPNLQPQSQIVLPHHNTGFYNYNGYNNYNNYTTNNAPPSNNSSFSLPSVSQPMYMDQQQQQQQQITEEGDRYRPVYYYSQPPHQVQPQLQIQGHPQQVQPPPFSQQLPPHEYSYGHSMVDQHAQPLPPNQLLQGGVGLGLPGTGSLPSAQLALNHYTNPLQPPSTGSSISSHPQSQEDAPFPGVLDPQYRSNPHFHPRSQTYPTESLNSHPKHKRLSSTSSSVSSSGHPLGMTPETARRNRCNICQKQFKRPSSLQTHLYSHTGEKPFACDWVNCGRLFSVRSNMIRHRKLHERDAKLKTDSPETSTTDSDLKTEDRKLELNNISERSTKLNLTNLKLKDGKLSSLNEVDESKTQNTVIANTTTSGAPTSTIPKLVHPTNTSAPTEFSLGW